MHFMQIMRSTLEQLFHSSSDNLEAREMFSTNRLETDRPLVRNIIVVVILLLLVLDRVLRFTLFS